jgi:hypothetical protein
MAAASLAVHAATYTITDGTTTVGPITFSGLATPTFVTFDSQWGAISLTIQSKPALGSALSPGISLGATVSSTGSTPLTITVSDDSFGPISAGTFTAMLDGHTLGGTGGIVTYNTYYDAGNVLGGTSGALTASGPLSPPYASTINSSAITATAYSLTLVLTIPGGGANYSLNASLAGKGGTVPPPPLAHGDTATIGFWHNKNGQQLIDSLNSGPNATDLGNWLATTFPCIWGGQNGAINLAGKSNLQIAAQFLVYFGVTGMKTDAQMMAVALASYATSTTLSGGTAAANYGFNVSPDGTGAKTFVVNGTTYTVLQLLKQANDAKCAGTFDANFWNTVFSNINQSGDIN